VLTPYPFQLRDDQHVPVLIMLSEFGLSDFGAGAARTFHLQPDTPNIRIWEFTGAPHIEADLTRDITAETNKSQPGQTLDVCNGPPTMPALVHGYGMRAALQALRDWVENIRTPDSAPRMSLIVPSAPDNFDQLVAFDRDPATNLTRGGIRLPAVAVPIATLDGNRSDLDDDAQGPGGGCYFSGAYDRWNHDADSWDGKAGLDPSPDPEPELLTLYPTHADYVRKVTTASLQSVAAGHLLPEDAVKVVLQAVRTPVP
jgi:Alpha/beta hydrolase domain